MGQRAVEATQKALAVLTALLDGTEGRNWDFANSVVQDYAPDDAGASDLIMGFANLGMVLVHQVRLLSGESTAGVLQKTSQVIAEMG